MVGTDVVADVLVVVGMLLLGIGLALWSVPLAFVVVGSLLMSAGLWSHLNHGDPGPPVPPPPAK